MGSFSVGVEAVSAYVPAGKFVVVKSIMTMTATSELQNKAKTYAQQLGQEQVKFIMLQPAMKDMEDLTEIEANTILSIVSDPEKVKSERVK